MHLKPFSLALATALSLASAASALSGQVHTAADAPLADVRVVVLGTNQSAWTDAAGSWTLEASSLTARARLRPAGASLPALRNDAGHLSLLPGGRTALGQGAAGPSRPGRASVAARASGSPDTLLFVVAGRIVARAAVALDASTPHHQVLDTAGVGGAPWKSGIAYGIVLDGRDGRSYRTVQAGGRTWMAENLDHQPAGVTIPWAQGSLDSGMKYGRHYTWVQALALDDSCAQKSCSTQVNRSAQGICPTGWELPTADDWNELAAAVGGSGTAGSRLKALAGWKSGSGSDDRLGFRALPAGRRDPDGDFRYQGTDAYWWSASENSRFDAVQRNMTDGGNAFYQGTGKTDGFSVRCVQKRP